MSLFELFVKVGVDDQASGKLKDIGGKIGEGLKTSAKVGTAAVTAASGAIVALTKQSVESYAEYEQLVGGAQLMFGDAFDFVQKKSKDAYKNVQMSQNEYLQQVNGFATGLKTALGGNEQAAAELADRIVQAEADIVAATGNTQENVANAFNGIMKSNFTMLDNLQIGITPTKEGFQEVIDKVNKWNETNGKATDYQMGNLADMQSALVDYIDMVGMSEYAQDEAAKTIQGSLAMTKASWQNLLTGMADEEADFDSLIENFVVSVSTFADNIIPRIGVALGGAADLISSLIPIVVNQIPTLFEQSLPTLLTAASDIITALSVGLADNADLLIQSGLDILLTLFNSLVDNAPTLIDAILEIIDSLVNWIAEYAYVFGEGALELILGLSASLINNLPELIPSIIYMITEMVNVLTNPENLAMLLQAALQIILAIGKGLVDSFPQMVISLAEVVSNILEFFTNEENRKSLGETALQLGKMLVEGLWEGVKSMASWIGNKLKGWFNDLIGDVKQDQEIHSPSRKWARLLGKPMGQGVGLGGVQGLEESEGMIIDELGKMTGNVSAAVRKQSISSYGTSYMSSTDILLTELISMFRNGTATTNVGNTRELRRAVNA